MPGTSSARSAPRTAFKLPTAVMFGCQLSSFATMVETDCGGAPCEAKNFLIITPLKTPKPKIRPSTTPTEASMITIRFVVVFIVLFL